MKICSTCKVEKPLSEFYKAKLKPGGYAYSCKQCSDEHNKKTRHKNPEKTRGHRKRSRDKFIEEMRAFKQGHGCKVCGESEPVCLDLHHTDPDIKDFHPSDATSRKLFYEEADKCVVLCANCHRKVHANIIELPL